MQSALPIPKKIFISYCQSEIAWNRCVETFFSTNIADFSMYNTSFLHKDFIYFYGDTMWQVKKLFTHAIYKEVTFNRPICKIRNIE